MTVSVTDAGCSGALREQAASIRNAGMTNAVREWSIGRLYVGEDRGCGVPMVFG